MVRAMAAPSARFDDVWPSPRERSGAPGGGPRPQGDHDAPPELRHGVAGGGGGCSSLPPGPSGGHSPTEDPSAGGLEENISACFGCFPAKADCGAPVSAIAEDTLLEKDEIWNALTSNYGRVAPVDWSRSRTRSLYISTFNLEEKAAEADVAEGLSDEEDLREQLDMHSIIVPCLAAEPLVTAEQVIEEIEEMMQDPSDTEAERRPSRSDLPVLDVQRSSPGFQERMAAMSAAELAERLEEAESHVRSLSEELVQQLAVRDELEFEKEVKNSFISALIDVQNRQKEHRESLKKKKKLKGGGGTSQGLAEKTPGSRFSMEGLSSVIQSSFRQTFRSGCSERQYLTTVIPYEKKGHPPSVEDLQILTKILQAMRDDSDKVPSLLTDYILNALV
ncbi:fasciculation and elongation protein zeta-2 isoform 2-T2 [Menidia menidia]